MNRFYDLSTNFILDLYRAKEKALKSNDKSAINSLKLTYPELFTNEFEEFIANLSDCIEYLYQTKGISYHQMLGEKPIKEDKSFH